MLDVVRWSPYVPTVFPCREAVPIVQDVVGIYSDCALGFTSWWVQGTFLHTTGDRAALQPKDPHTKLVIWAAAVKFTFTERAHYAADELG